MDLEWHWNLSLPESRTTWLPVKAQTHIVSVSGTVTAQVYRVGPTYHSYSRDHGTSRLWLRDLGIDSWKDKVQVDNVVDSLQYLTAVLKSQNSFKVRNFVSLDNSTPDAYLRSRVFLATDMKGIAFVGVGPSTTQPGDTLVQFLKTDAVLIVRESHRPDFAEMVGRGGIVKGQGSLQNPSWDVLTEHDFAASKMNQVFEGYLTLEQLTRLSFDTTILDAQREKYRSTFSSTRTGRLNFS